MKVRFHIQKNMPTQYLNNKSQQAPQPKFMKTIKLLPYQKAIIAALEEWESSHIWMNHRTDYLYVQLPPGTGKTHAILGHILSKPIPPQFEKLERLYFNKQSYVNALRIEDSRQYLPFNIVFVASSVFEQWKEALDQIEELNYLAIAGAKEFEHFGDLINTGSILYYQIILVKLGDITSNMKYFDMSNYVGRSSSTKYSTIATMSTMLNQFTVARVVIDDYDVGPDIRTLELPDSSIYLLVSATANKQQVESIDPSRRCGVMLNSMLNNMYVLTADINWVNACSQITRVQGKEYKIQNPNRELIDAVGLLGNKELEKMLNGDAIDTAAKTAGVKVNSISAILKKMLQNKYVEYIEKRKLMDIFDESKIKNWMDESEDCEGAEKELSANKIKNIIADAKREKMITFPDYYDEGLAQALLDTYEGYKTICDDIGGKVNSVLERFIAGTCPVCSSSLKNGPVVIMTCCNMVFCRKCAIVTMFSRLTFKTDDKLNHNTMIKCTHCRSNILYKQTFELDATNMNNLIDMLEEQEKVEEESIVDEEEESNINKKANQERDENRVNVKIETIIKIIKNERMGNNVEVLPVEYPVNNSDRNIPWDPTTMQRKFLLFSDYEESLEKMSNRLSAAGIKCHILQGTTKSIRKIVDKFRADNSTVLLINSVTKCAGLNLQFASDIILTHIIDNTNIKTQVLGRARRLGRECNLTVHQLYYV